MGAGVIPFAVVEQQTLFLFQTVFSGRKAGHLIDFGGGLDDGETPRDCAIREFVEETETMYFADDLAQAKRSDVSIARQIPLVQARFDATLADHPDWWCRRSIGDPNRPKDWKTFFVELPYRDVRPMNRAWREDLVGRFKKRRELVWVTADELIAIYESSPERLWKRVRQLEGAPALIQQIKRQSTG